MMKLSAILKDKGREVWSVNPDTSVYDAVHLMAEKEIGALTVMDGSRLVGIVSERDYARQIILKGRSSETTKVSEIMTTNVVHATPEQKTTECSSLMTEHRIRHLPVLEESAVVGIVSMGDLVRSIIAEQDSTINDLNKYIAG
jgi:CBS domain-containing protein